MDYINIGSPGYAQVGQSDYNEKLNIEKVVVNLHVEKNYPIPLKLQDICYFKWKAFQHDFGTYHELCLVYDDKYLNTLEDDNEIIDIFWEFANKCECMDFELLEEECIFLVNSNKSIPENV